MASHDAPPDLVVSGIGIVSSVGRDAVTACASVRAGLERRAPVGGAVALAVDGHEVVAVAGHPVRPLTDGFASVARWLQLAPEAFRDLARTLPGRDDAAFWRATRVLTVLPDPDEDRWAHDPLVSAEALHGSFLAPLYRTLGLPVPDPRDRVTAAGRVGLVQILAGADELLSAARADRLVVVAVDSLLDGASLDGLGADGRLRAADSPEGLAPGEAAVALLVERREAARARAAAPLAALSGAVALRPQSDHLFDFVAAGRVLGDALRVCLTRPGHPPAADVSLAADLNGEAWKSKAYGHAFSRVPVDARPGLEWTVSATAVGDLGAATSAFDVALAARALQRGYAPSRATAVAACSDDGAAGVCLLTAVP